MAYTKVNWSETTPINPANLDHMDQGIADLDSGKANCVPGDPTTATNADTLDGNHGSWFVPPGAVMAFARNTPPNGWLECNGQAVSRTTYADLFTAIGTTFGAGDGSTTFNLPDLRGEFIRGWDHGRGIDSGRNFGSWEADEFKSHRHKTDDSWSAEGGEFVPTRKIKNTYSDVVWQDLFTEYAGGSETRPRNVALMYCIKY